VSGVGAGGQSAISGPGAVATLYLTNLTAAPGTEVRFITREAPSQAPYIGAPAVWGPQASPPFPLVKGRCNVIRARIERSGNVSSSISTANGTVNFTPYSRNAGGATAGGVSAGLPGSASFIQFGFADEANNYVPWTFEGNPGGC